MDRPPFVKFLCGLLWNSTILTMLNLIRAGVYDAMRNPEARKRLRSRGRGFRSSGCSPSSSGRRDFLHPGGLNHPDGGSGRQDGAAGTKTEGRQAEMTVRDGKTAAREDKKSAWNIRMAVRMTKTSAGIAKNGAGKIQKAFGRSSARAGGLPAGSLTSEVRQGMVRRATPLACRIHGARCHARTGQGTYFFRYCGRRSSRSPGKELLP